MDAGPEISVVVPSHDRPLRLRWLLNALEDQTLARGRWEVIVSHDSVGPETDKLLREHPLALDGTLRFVSLQPGSAPPGANRNAAWRRARAPIVAFTDDDCRPPAEWLEKMLSAGQRHPNSIVQGHTLPDPHEAHHMHAAHARSQTIHPPGPYAEACNILYPLELLERVGGFDEGLQVGEDVDLALRGRQAGADYLGAPEVLTYHAVATPTLRGTLRTVPRWSDLPELLKRHPAHRREYPLGLFWKRSHPLVLLVLAGAILARRNAAFSVLALPWMLDRAPHYGSRFGTRARAIGALPGLAVVDLAELGVLLKGSVKYRTLFL